MLMLSVLIWLLTVVATDISERLGTHVAKFLVKGGWGMTFASFRADKDMFKNHIETMRLEFMGDIDVSVIPVHQKHVNDIKQLIGLNIFKLQREFRVGSDNGIMLNNMVGNLRTTNKNPEYTGPGNPTNTPLSFATYIHCKVSSINVNDNGVIFIIHQVYIAYDSIDKTYVVPLIDFVIHVKETMELQLINELYDVSSPLTGVPEFINILGVPRSFQKCHPPMASPPPLIHTVPHLQSTPLVPMPLRVMSHPPPHVIPMPLRVMSHPPPHVIPMPFRGRSHPPPHVIPMPFRDMNHPPHHGIPRPFRDMNRNSSHFADPRTRHPSPF